MRIVIAILFVLSAMSAGAQDRFEATGPYSGGASQVYVGSDGVLYALTPALQVMRSTTDGVNWKECSDFDVDTNISYISGALRLAVDSSGILYGNYGPQIWRSRDSGRTWALRYLPFGSFFHFGSFLEVARNGTLYASALSGLDTGIYRSIDQGDHWELMRSPGSGSLAVDRLGAGPDGTIIAGRLGGIWRTTNDGADWTKMDLAMADFEHAEVLVAAGGGRMWAMIAPNGRFATSTNNGEKWTEIRTEGLPANTKSFNLATTATGALLLSMETGLYFSFDEGQNWGPARQARSATGTRWVAASRSGTVFGITDDLERSFDNGIRWVSSLSAASPLAISKLVETRDSTAIVAATFTGIFRSADGGTTWLPSGGGSLPNLYQAYTIFRGKGNTLFTSSLLGGGLYRSMDNGLSWNRANGGLTANWIGNGLMLHDSTLLLTSDKGVWRSTDNGERWSRVGVGIGLDTMHSLTQLSDGTVLLATRGLGVFRSSDNGTTWTPSGSIAPEVWSFHVTPEGTVFASAAKDGFFRSRDGGKRWEQVGGILAANYGWSWEQNPAGTIYLGAEMIQRSTDNGNSWSLAINYQLAGNEQATATSIAWGLLYDHTGQLHIGRTSAPGQGVYRMIADSGSRWRKRPRDIGEVHAIRNAAGGGVLFGSTLGAFYSNTFPSDSITFSVDRVIPGTEVLVIDNLIVSRESRPSSFTLAGTADGLFSFYWAMDSASWQWKRVGAEQFTGRVSDLAVELNGKWIYAATEHGVYRSNDTAASWTGPGAGLGDLPVCSLVLTGMGSLLAASPGHGLYRSDDRGLTWSPVTTGFPPAGDITAMTIIGARTIYIGTAGAGVWRSGDDGATWTRTGPIPGQDSITSITVSSEGLLFAGTYDGAWRSVDRGATWTRVSPEQRGEITAVGTGNAGRIYIASRDGLYESTTDPVEREGTVGVPRSDRLRAVSGTTLRLQPNPANGVSTLHYALARASHVRITIIDIAGRAIGDLLESDQSAGDQTLRIDTGTLSAGRYYIRMTIGGTSTTQSLTVTR